jgi:DNA invertase Pin-like site-specific DNA recombinase
MTDFIAYVRVSTQKQGASGLGLEAQQAAIADFLKPGDERIMPDFVEVESGKRTDQGRPQLAAALAKCRKTGATLLVAKLDRLSRNVPFLRSLIDGDVDVAFCDLPNVPVGAMGRFLLTQMASVAELEAGLTSERTKAALKAAKERNPDLKLGGYRGYTPDGALGSKKAAALRSVQADKAAHRLMRAIEKVKAGIDGKITLRAIADGLNEAKVRTAGGHLGKWTPMAVSRVLQRVEAA